MNDERYINAADAVKLGFADSIMTRSAVKEDKAASDAAAQLYSVRKVESLLAKKCGMSRASARDLIHDLTGAQREAGATDDGTREAAGTMWDAWVGDAKALLDKLKS
jgi:hypothetical protein